MDLFVFPMNDAIEGDWSLTIWVNTKNQATQLKEPDQHLRSLSSIFHCLEPIKFPAISLYFDLVLERDDNQEEPKTRINIVNFSSEISSKLYVDLIYNIFKKHLQFRSDVTAIVLQRKNSNFMIMIDLKGFDNLSNPSNIEALNDFLNRNWTTPDDPHFSIEILPIPRPQYQNGLKKLSTKNTADSVKNWIKKQWPDNSNP